MKLTSKITELLFELSYIESSDNNQLLMGDGGRLRKNLLTLYRQTEKEQSQDIIIKIMEESGYPWFGKLAKSSDVVTDVRDEPAVAQANVNLDELQDTFLTEEEFLDLLPVNGHFH